MSKARYSQELHDKAIDMVREGMTIPQACNELGLMYNTVYCWCRREGVGIPEAPRGIAAHRRPYKVPERCPQCGALKSHWNGEAKTIDLSLVGRPTCHNVSEWNAYDVFTCSECGKSFEVSEFKFDVHFGVLDIDAPYEYEPRFCPNCGAKVVGE